MARRKSTEAAEPAEAETIDEVDAAQATTSNSLEAGIRAYLNYLADPNIAVDMDEVMRLEVAAENAEDLVEKLRILGQLERARTPDPSYLEDEFVRNVKEWAAAEGVGASVFISMGVSEDVLRRARMLKGRATPQRRQRGGARSGRVTVEAMQEWALDQDGTFTIREVTEALGGSLVTAKKALQLLVDAGSLDSAGADPDHRGPGRAPNRYTVAGRRGRSKSRS